MDYIALCKKLCRESGTLAENALTSVVGQTGRANKIVNWVNDAWTNIQNSRYGWYWMRAEYTAQLAIDTPRYTAASWSLDRWGEWANDTPYIHVLSLWDPALGAADEHPIEQIPYRTFYDRFVRSVNDNRRPVFWSISNAGELCFAPTPDKAYMIRHLYVKSPQVLAANTDIPEMPARFHDMIVQEAHRLLMIGDGAYAESDYVAQEFARMRGELERDQLPPLVFGDCAVDAA